MNLSQYLCKGFCVLWELLFSLFRISAYMFIDVADMIMWKFVSFLFGSGFLSTSGISTGSSTLNHRSHFLPLINWFTGTMFHPFPLQNQSAWHPLLHNHNISIQYNSVLSTGNQFSG